MDIYFYTTSACHLCDKAEALLWPLIDSRVHLHKIDIASSDVLIERYGLRIPLLVREGRELAWPFEQDQLAAFLSE